MGKFVNIELFKFATSVVKEAKLNLGATRKGRRTDSTGKLRKSINFSQNKNKDSVYFEMEEYGAYVDSGRDGTMKRRRTKRGIITTPNNGRFPNIKAIRQWINDKPIRPRNLKTNKFVKKTDRTLNSMAFLIGRKIKEQGIEPTYFLSDAIRKYEDELSSNVAEAVWNDLKTKI